jgi:PRTRC genetic system protein C
MMKEIKISRVFTYNGIKLDDPNPALQPDAVREFYVPQYQELTTAVVEGPVTKDNVATYTFRRAAGAKLQAIARGEVTDSKQMPLNASMFGNMGRIYENLMGVTKGKAASRPLQMPSEAFGFWG